MTFSKLCKTVITPKPARCYFTHTNNKLRKRQMTSHMLCSVLKIAIIKNGEGMTKTWLLFSSVVVLEARTS